MTRSTCRRVSALFLFCFLAVAQTGRAAFTSYNDLKWASGQVNSWITTFNPSETPGGGSLVDYNTHGTLGVTVAFSGAATVFDNAVTTPPALSDAYNAFNGIVDQNSYTYLNTGDVVMTFANLNPAKVYEFAYYATRGGATAAYSNRQTHVIISSVTAFTNVSSAGTTMYTTTTANDSAYVLAANLDGKLIQFVGINPGPDGTIMFTLRGIGTNGEANIGYGNAFRLKEIDPGGPGPGGFVAYNDTAWHQDASLFSGQGVEPATVNYTTNSPWGKTNGTLLSDSGQPLTTQVSFSGSPVGLNMLARNFAIPGTTDVSTIFAAKIGTNNAINWTGGTVTMTLSGLDSAKQYSLVLWSSRGGTSASYSNRWTDITLKSVDLFTNNSSSGLTKFTTTTSNDSTRVVSALDGGRVARYDGIQAGVDGTVVVDLTANGLASGDTNGYLNAFMLQEFPGTVTPTVPVIANGSPTVLGSTSATLAGSLSSTGYLPTQVWVYWKAGSDAGTSKLSWASSMALGYSATGAVTYTVTNLIASTTYYYRYYASNSVGDAWAATPQNFTTPSGVTTNATNSTRTIKIMPIGDSITQSAAGYASYRYWLWKLLTVSNNYNVEFIGANTNGVNGPPLYSDFNPHHAGYWGWAAYEVDQAISTNGPYYSGTLFGPSDASGVLQTNNYYGTNIPDIALIHLGHNDVNVGWKAQGPGITNATNCISILIDHLRQRNTNMIILLAQNVPENPGGPGFSFTNDAITVAKVNELAAAIPTLAASKTLPSSPVIAVDQHSGYDVTNDTWSTDGVHPTQSGEIKIANKWFAALQSWLPSLTATNDADTNGMADGWEVWHFGRYGQSPTADPDGDGLNNLQEYILGSSPLQTTAWPMFRDSAQPGGFAIDTASQRVYRVDYRTNIVTGAWQLYTNIIGNGAPVTLTPSNAPDRENFYRFKVRVGP